MAFPICSQDNKVVETEKENCLVPFQKIKVQAEQTYLKIDSPPRPVPRGSPVCMIKSLYE